MFKLFLKTKGAIGRRDFWIGFIGLAILVMVYNTALRYLSTSAIDENNMIGFWLVIFGLPLLVFMIYCVFGKRLTDMGRTRWPFTGAIVLEILVIIVLMLAFGGADYFHEFSQYDRKTDIDPVRQQAIISTYQAQQAANMHIIRPAMLIVPLILTLWVGLTPSRKSA